MISDVMRPKLAGGLPFRNMTTMWGAPFLDRWRRTRRDPAQARFLTLASLRWVRHLALFYTWDDPSRSE